MRGGEVVKQWPDRADVPHVSSLGLAEMGESLGVTILPDGVHVTAGSDETLLRALGRTGLRYRVGCKRGGCGICKVQLLFGEVRYERPIASSVLSDDERVERICLSCRAVPLTDIVIELQEGDRLRRVLGFMYPGSTDNSHGT